jgi:hypothetical protein
MKITEINAKARHKHTAGSSKKSQGKRRNAIKIKDFGKKRRLKWLISTA